MVRLRIFLLLLSFCYVFLQEGFSQLRPSQPQATDIFGDLPINDPSANSRMAPGEIAEEKIRKNIFVTAFLNKSSCYVGEPVLLNVELQSALTSISTIQGLPSLQGFQIIEMDADNSFPRSRQVNGTAFSVFTVKRSQLIPVKEGHLEIGAITIENVVGYKNGKKDFKYSGKISSKPVYLEVRPLPDTGRPGGFQGTVGNYTIHATVQKDTLPAGENNLLKIEVAGSGNFFSVSLPTISWLSPFHVFDYSEKSDLNEAVYPVKGKTSFSVPFIVDSPGEHSIPAVELNFFDPVSKRYRKSVSPPIRLLVGPPLARPKKDIPVRRVEVPAGVPENFWWYITGIFGFAGLGLYVIRAVKTKSEQRRLAALKEKSRQDALIVKEEEFHSAIARLKTLETSPDFVLEYKSMLVAFLNDRVITGRSGLEVLVDEVHVKDKSLGEDLSALLNECEMMLYGNVVPDQATRESMFSRLHSVVHRINQIWVG